MKKVSILALVIFAALAVTFIVLAAGIKSSKKFRADYHPEVKTEVGADGHAAVGGAAFYRINISPALAWTKGTNNAKAWRVVAWILLIGAAVYIACAELGVFQGSIHVAFVVLAISLACYLAAYSSAYANNYKDVSVETFENIRYDQQALEGLFSKPLIR